MATLPSSRSVHFIQHEQLYHTGNVTVASNNNNTNGATANANISGNLSNSNVGGSDSETAFAMKHLQRLRRTSGSGSTNASSIQSVHRTLADRAAQDQSIQTRPRDARPGSRRYRRYLNSLLSDYDNESLSEWDSEIELALHERLFKRMEQDPEIVRFEWKSLFVEAGEEFFNSTGKGFVGSTGEVHNKRHEVQNLTRLQRRILSTMKHRQHERRKRRELKQLHMRQRKAQDLRDFGSQLVESNVESWDDSDEYIEIQKVKNENYEAKDNADKHHSEYATQQSEENSSAKPLSSSKQSRKTSSPIRATSTTAEQLDFSFLSGQEVAETLWLGIDRALRSKLRRMYDFSFLMELENLLIAYKFGRLSGMEAYHLHQKQRFRNFDVISPNSIANLPAAESTQPVRHRTNQFETTIQEFLEDDIDWNSMAANNRYEIPLVLSFSDEFLQFLSSGVFTFHLLKASAVNPAKKSSRSHSTLLSITRRGDYIPHTAILSAYIQEIQESH